MEIQSLFINPATHRLRSGWRALVYFAVLSLPNLILSNLFKGSSSPSAPASNSFDISWAMVAIYAVMNVWVAFVSIAAFRWLDGANWQAWGYALHLGWARDLFIGLLAGLLMIVAVIGFQVIGGGTRLHAAMNGISWRAILTATVLLWLAAAFEELLFRGYAFQTLLRDIPAWVPIIILNIFFGLAHWTNPSRTTFSTLNTVLAGVWLALAVMRTRSLWLATGLHFSWNWTMGVLFGLPVSGMRMPHTFLYASSVEPYWLTGGSYGSEGGVAATLAFAMAAVWIWRTGLLRVAPQTERALSDQTHI